MISRRMILTAAITAATLIASSVAHADFSQGSQGMNSSGGNSGMSMDGGSMSSGGKTQTSPYYNLDDSANLSNQGGFENLTPNPADADSDEDTVNSDTYSVDEPKIYMGNLVLTNVGEIDISNTLYVYGDMEVTNVDSFVVSGKLRVTGKLTVTNGSLELKGGTLYVGKKKFINGSLKGKPRKIHSSLVKIDQYLQTEISQEQLDEIISTVKEADKEYKMLSKELVTVKKQKGDVLGVGEKLVQNRQDLFAELEQYIQEEDLKAFAKIEAKEIAVAKTYYKKVTGKKDL